MVVERAKNISLHRAGNEFKTGRSFHLGNLTIRDMVPLVAGCEGEVFDLNMMSDTAYFPTKLVFQNRISDILLQNQTDYVATSVIKSLPRISSSRQVGELVDKAYENSKTLGGFWMRLNEELGIGEFKTFSQKINTHKSLVEKILTKVTHALAPEKLGELWSRYVYRDSLGQERLLRFSEYSREREFFIYTDGQNQVKVHKNDIVQLSLDFFQHWSKLSHEQVDLQDTLPQCQGPLFSNEMNTVLLYLIDAIRNENGKVYHVGGQAMYGYIHRSHFLTRVKHILELIDDDHNITNGLQLDGIEILPAHFFRLLGYDKALLENLSQVFTHMEEIDQLNKQKGELFKQKMTHTDQPVQELMSRVKLVRESQDELVRSLAQHPEIRSMPYPTLREGTLCEPYHSQLDLYAKMREGFNPKEERRFVLDQDLGRIQTVIDKVIGQVLPK